MQAVGGSRGAAAYSADALDYDFDQVNKTLHDMDAFSRLPSREGNSMWTNYLGITLRNQVRQGDPTPLQFLFQAADCRIYYTLENIYNMSQLWRDAAHSTWIDPSRCVNDSTGYPTARNTTSTKEAPITVTQIPSFEYGLIPDSPFDVNSTFDLIDGPKGSKRKDGDFPPCKEGSSLRCREMKVTCNGKPKRKTVYAFSKNCKGDADCRKPKSFCRDFVVPPSKDHASRSYGSDEDTQDSIPLESVGWCILDVGTPKLCGTQDLP